MGEALPHQIIGSIGARETIDVDSGSIMGGYTERESEKPLKDTCIPCSKD